MAHELSDKERRFLRKKYIEGTVLPQLRKAAVAYRNFGSPGMTKDESNTLAARYEMEAQEYEKETQGLVPPEDPGDRYHRIARMYAVIEKQRASIFTVADKAWRGLGLYDVAKIITNVSKGTGKMGGRPPPLWHKRALELEPVVRANHPKYFQSDIERIMLQKKIWGKGLGHHRLGNLNSFCGNQKSKPKK